LNRVQNGSGAHPASYLRGTRGSFPGNKAAGAWSWPLTSIQCRGQECVERYLHSPVHPHGVVLVKRKAQEQPYLLNNYLEWRVQHSFGGETS